MSIIAASNTISIVEPDSWLSNLRDRYGDATSNTIEYNRNIFDVVAQCKLNGIESHDIINLLTSNEWKSIVASDTARKLSDNVSSYFERKFFTQRMLGKEMTEFRKTAISLLKNNRKVKVSHLPILVKLFDFYEEDSMFDSLIEKFTPIKTKDIPNSESIVEMVYLDTYDRYRKNIKEKKHIMQYGTHIAILSEAIPVYNNSLQYVLSTMRKVNIKASWNFIPMRDHEDFTFISAQKFTII